MASPSNTEPKPWPGFDHITPSNAEDYGIMARAERMESEAVKAVKAFQPQKTTTNMDMAKMLEAFRMMQRDTFKIPPSNWAPWDVKYGEIPTKEIESNIAKAILLRSMRTIQANRKKWGGADYRKNVPRWDGEVYGVPRSATNNINVPPETSQVLGDPPIVNTKQIAKGRRMAVIMQGGHEFTPGEAEALADKLREKAQEARNFNKGPYVRKLGTY